MLEPILDTTLSFLRQKEVIFWLAVASGLVQALGYLIYGFKAFRNHIVPNASSWAMFAYGTLLLTFLEWESDAGGALLVLPIVCVVASTVIFFLCLQRGRFVWPQDIEDRVSFSTDLCLTVLYILAWLALFFDFFSKEQMGIAVLVFLIASNATTVTSFIPILREAYYEPSHEHQSPWVLWTVAYFLLLLVTAGEESDWVLYLYPVANIVLHLSIAWMVRHSRQERYKKKTAPA